MRTHVDKDEPSYQAQAVTTCFAPAGNGTEAMAEEREDVDVREVVVHCERREERSEAVVRLVCALRSDVYMRTFRPTVMRHMAWAPWRGWSLSCLLGRVAGSGSMAR